MESRIIHTFENPHPHLVNVPRIFRRLQSTAVYSKLRVRTQQLIALEWSNTSIQELKVVFFVKRVCEAEGRLTHAVFRD